LTHLGDGHDVWPNPAVLYIEVLARAPKARLYFINDKQYPMLITDFAQSLQISSRCRYVPTLAKNGLDNDRSRIVGRALLLEDKLELVQRGSRDFLLRRVRREAELVPEGIGSSVYRTHERSDGFAVDCLAPRKSHSSIGASMIRSYIQA
jgi:hypothetical protein